MTDPAIDPDEVVAEAKRFVEACAIAQVGDHHSMAEAEVMSRIEQLEEPNLCYAVVKTFAGTVAAFAAAVSENESEAISFIREAVANLEIRTEPRPPSSE
jgi:hypothetical protein